MLLANKDSLFDEMFREPFFPRPFENTSSQFMKTDVHENDKSYLLEIELPGYSKDDIEASLENGYLTIKGTKNSSHEEKDDKGNCIRCERYSGNCQRSFFIGKDITPEDIKASFTDGILSLTVPKRNTDLIENNNKISIE